MHPINALPTHPISMCTTNTPYQCTANTPYQHTAAVSSVKPAIPNCTLSSKNHHPQPLLALLLLLLRVRERAKALAVRVLRVVRVVVEMIAMASLLLHRPHPRRRHLHRHHYQRRRALHHQPREAVRTPARWAARSGARRRPPRSSPRVPGLAALSRRVVAMVELKRCRWWTTVVQGTTTTLAPAVRTPNPARKNPCLPLLPQQQPPPSPCLQRCVSCQHCAIGDRGCHPRHRGQSSDGGCCIAAIDHSRYEYKTAVPGLDDCTSPNTNPL